MQDLSVEVFMVVGRVMFIELDTLINILWMQIEINFL